MTSTCHKRCPATSMPCKEYTTYILTRLVFYILATAIKPYLSFRNNRSSSSHKATQNHFHTLLTFTTICSRTPIQPRLPLPSCPPLPGRPVREARKSRTHPSKARLLQKASFAAISFVMCAVRHALSCMASVLYYGWSHARVALFDLHAAPEAQEAQGLFGCLGRQTCTQRPVLLSYPPHLQIPRFCSYCSQQAHLFASFISSFIPVLKKKPENRHPRKIKKTLQESEATLNKKLLQSPSLDSPSLWSTSLTVFGF